MSPAAAPPSGQKRLLWLVVGLCVLPIVVVALLFAVGWRPASSVAHGVLLEASELPLAALKGVDGRALPVVAVRGRWLLLVASAGRCEAACRQRVDEVRRVHVALNKNMERARRVWLTTSPQDDPALKELPSAYPDMITARPTGPEWSDLVPGAGTQVYVIDPVGRPVLRYPDSADARGILKDVDRLLKYSWVG